MGDSCTCDLAHCFTVFQAHAGKILDASGLDVNSSLLPHRYLTISRFSLTFIVPLVAYYVALDHFHANQQGSEFESQQDIDQQDNLIWESRLIALSVALGVWFVMFLPIAIWKYVVSLVFAAKAR